MVRCTGHYSSRTWTPTGFCFAALEQFEYPRVPPSDSLGSLIPVCKPTYKVVQLMVTRTKSWQLRGFPRPSFWYCAWHNIILKTAAQPCGLWFWFQKDGRCVCVCFPALKTVPFYKLKIARKLPYNVHNIQGLFLLYFFCLVVLSSEQCWASHSLCSLFWLGGLCGEITWGKGTTRDRSSSPGWQYLLWCVPPACPFIIAPPDPAQLSQNYLSGTQLSQKRKTGSLQPDPAFCR